MSNNIGGNIGGNIGNNDMFIGRQNHVNVNASRFR